MDREHMNNDIDPPSRFDGDKRLERPNAAKSTLTDLIDEMDRASFRRALELRDTKLTPRTSPATAQTARDSEHGC